MNILHQLDPSLIHLLEFRRLIRHLLLDIFRGENRLEIAPLLLDLDPKFQELHGELKPILPSIDLCFKLLRKARPLHGLGLDQLILKKKRGLFD